MLLYSASADVRQVALKVQVDNNIWNLSAHFVERHNLREIGKTRGANIVYNGLCLIFHRVIA